MKKIIAKVVSTYKKIVAFLKGHKDEILELKLKIEICLDTIEELKAKLKEVEGEATDIKDTAEELVQQLKEELEAKDEEIDQLKMQVAVHEFLMTNPEDLKELE